ncbi:hypothetical protein AYJ57_03735 [Salipiger sp. CCB-MM3]|nr:hypothetical protein AYJ57_03735 [Salipiger sp. CCB-MM3]
MGAGNVLSRKADAARRAFEARAMSPAKALRRALSRTADVLWDLALVTRAVDLDHFDQDGVVAQLRPDALLVLLYGPDGVVGLVSLERDLVVGLTEVQTMLQVTQMPADPRPYTATDAAMSAPLLEGMLERFPRFLEDHPLRAQLEGFRFGAMLEDARAAGMLLDAPGYLGFRAEIDLALGRRKGGLRLFLPERPGAQRAGAEAETGGNARKMELLPAQLRAVLGALRMPLGKAQALKPGDILPLPPDVLDRVTLYAGASPVTAKPVAGGRLGQMNGMRAIRLSWPKGQGAAASAAPAAPAQAASAPAASPMVDAAPAPSEAAEFGLDEIASGLPDLPALGGADDFAADFAGGFDAAAAMPEEGEEAGDFDFDFSAARMSDDP